MNPSTHVVSPLRQRMIEDMRLRKLNGKTQIAYVRAVRRLAGFLRRSPDTATGEDLRRFQLHMVDQGTSSMTINTPVAGRWRLSHTQAAILRAVRPQKAISAPQLAHFC